MQYTIKVLEGALVKEKSNLELWNKSKLSSDMFAVRQAEGSIPSCTKRIEELQKSIEIIKTNTPINEHRQENKKENSEQAGK